MITALLFVLFSRAADLGPPATTYGARDPVPPTKLEAKVEARVLGEDAARLAPSGSLRTYTRSLLSVPGNRDPDVQTKWFLAEHAGLHALPSATHWFSFHGEGARAMASYIRTAIAEHVKDPRVTEVAIAFYSKRLVGPGHQWIIFATSGHPPDLASITIRPDSHVLAIGQASGLVHKDALTPQTVLLIVVAKDAR